MSPDSNPPLPPLPEVKQRRGAITPDPVAAAREPSIMQSNTQHEDVKQDQQLSSSSPKEDMSSSCPPPDPRLRRQINTAGLLYSQLNTKIRHLEEMNLIIGDRSNSPTTSITVLFPDNFRFGPNDPHSDKILDVPSAAIIRLHALHVLVQFIAKGETCGILRESSVVPLYTSFMKAITWDGELRDGIEDRDEEGVLLVRKKLEKILEGIATRMSTKDFNGRRLSDLRGEGREGDEREEKRSNKSSEIVTDGRRRWEDENGNKTVVRVHLETDERAP